MTPKKLEPPTCHPIVGEPERNPLEPLKLLSLPLGWPDESIYGADDSARSRAHWGGTMHSTDAAHPVQPPITRFNDRRRSLEK